MPFLHSGGFAAIAGPEVWAAERERVREQLIEDGPAAPSLQQPHEQPVVCAPESKESREARRTGRWWSIAAASAQPLCDFRRVCDRARTDPEVRLERAGEVPRMFEAAQVGGHLDQRQEP